MKKGVWDLLGILAERAVRWLTHKSIPVTLTYMVINIKTIFWAMGNLIFGQKGVWDSLGLLT